MQVPAARPAPSQGELKVRPPPVTTSVVRSPRVATSPRDTVRADSPHSSDLEFNEIFPTLVAVASGSGRRLAEPEDFEREQVARSPTRRVENADGVREIRTPVLSDLIGSEWVTPRRPVRARPLVVDSPLQQQSQLDALNSDESDVPSLTPTSAPSVNSEVDDQ